MKKSALVICIILTASLLLNGCVASLIPSTSDHTHQWQDVPGEHARICTECEEKELKSEACNFVRENCEQPMKCTVCHATNDAPPEEHDWSESGRECDCWSETITYTCSKCDVNTWVHSDWAIPEHYWKVTADDEKTTYYCSRCDDSYTFLSEVGEFSYEAVLEQYKIGDPGVKHEHFNNFNVESEIKGAIDAIVRAEFELTVEYDTISVSYDETSNMWRVDFWTLDLDGNSQSVYINGNGLTCYIVYGE